MDEVLSRGSSGPDSINAEFPQAGRPLQNGEPQVTDAGRLRVGVRRFQRELRLSAIRFPGFPVHGIFQLISLAGGRFYEISLGAFDPLCRAEVNLPPGIGV